MPGSSSSTMWRNALLLCTLLAVSLSFVPTAASFAVSLNSPRVSSRFAPSIEDVRHRLARRADDLNCIPCARPTAGPPVCIPLPPGMGPGIPPPNPRPIPTGSAPPPSSSPGPTTAKSIKAAAAADVNGTDIPDSVLAFNSKLRTVNVYNAIGAIILIITGLLFIFSGHKLFKLILFIAGFYTGSVLAFIILSQIEAKGHSFGDSRSIIFLVVGVVLGLIVGSLFQCVWKLGLIAIGAILGFTLAMFVLSLAKNGLISQGTGRTIFIIALTIIGGVLVLFFEKPILVLGTSVGGAFAVMFGVDIFTKVGLVEASQQFLAGNALYEPDKWVYVELAAWAILAVVGIIAQWNGLRGGKSHHNNHKDGFGGARSVGPAKPVKAKGTPEEKTGLRAEFEKIVVKVRK
ncbi:uncharacterized protein EV422DRAFT_8094 [Fimicolochytrium jonesii]|uniref:uncharacterized protein n=1 Tax=Fimicolochytrium jonesii TaxID=1396493 RepID=UPI0022FF2FA9|nr:uncharacterized protein EV422DRAFT_8094 [Fimicolochytrium jonesii]KAI8826733.1 hypothetical protein EV422DRAFT_8094 [Fimicolochytrium jonesii]